MLPETPLRSRMCPRSASRPSETAVYKRQALGLVVGATYPAELANVRRIAPNLPLLVPGIGAQGGDIRACVEAGKTAEGTGMVINSGRAIIYASREDDWKEAARKTAIATRDSIQAAV